MVREECDLALTLDDLDDLGPTKPSRVRSTLLPPAPPAGEFDLVGLGDDVLSFAALEAAIDALPFDDEGGGLRVALNDNATTEGDAADDGLSVNDRPTRRYTVPEVPPFMRPTVRPEAQPEA